MEVWDLQTKDASRTLKAHDDSFGGFAAFSPDGKYVLTASVDRTARLWDAATGSEVRVFEHPNVVGSIAFSPDGKTIATGGEDNVNRLWDVNTGELLDTFVGHTGFVQGVSFSPDGRLLLTGSADRTARLWDLATGETIHVNGGTPMVSLFMPTTPNPTTGFMMLVATDQVRDVNIGIEDAMRVIMSGGILLPNLAPDVTWLKPLHDRAYDPLWELCSELELPVHVHGGTDSIATVRRAAGR